MERLERFEKLILAALPLALALTLPMHANAQDSQPKDKPENMREAPAKPKRTLMLPEFTFRVKDGRLLAQLFQKNKWFLDFRQTGFYQGALSGLGPVLFSPADDHGNAAGSWKGRLLDYVYEKLLENRPMNLHYYRKPSLQSPFAISVTGLSKAEISASETLIKALKSADLRKVEVEEKVELEVTPILVKQQKFGVVLRDGCLTIGRSPDAVAAAAAICPKLGKPDRDAELKLNLHEAFPSLSGVREKFLGVLPEATVDFAWKSSESKLVPTETRVDLAAGQHLVLKDKVPDELLRAIPSGAIFFTTGFIPSPKDGFAPPSIEKYLKSDKAGLRKAKPQAVALAYLGVEATEAKMTRALPALLIHQPNASPATVEQLAKTFGARGSYEIFVRRVCTNVIAIAPSKDAVELVQAVCDKKRPSFEQMPEKIAGALKAKTLSGAFFMNPGRLLSVHIENGWKKKKKEAPPAEIKASRDLVEQLPAYLFTGAADDKRLIMKAVQ